MTTITPNGPNSNTVTLGELKLLFSYTTLVALRRSPEHPVVYVGGMSPTTKKQIRGFIEAEGSPLTETVETEKELQDLAESLTAKPTQASTPAECGAETEIEPL